MFKYYAKTEISFPSVLSGKFFVTKWEYSVTLNICFGEVNIYIIFPLTWQGTSFSISTFDISVDLSVSMA